MRPLPLLTLLLTLTFIGSAFVTPFDGFDGAQVPIPQDDPPIQPAGWAFSIWSIIYAWLLASAAYGLWRRAEDPDWDRVRLPLVLSLALGTPWLAIASRSAIWATLVIALMLAAAILAFLRAPARDRWLLRAPVGLYAGWLTAAAFVSLGATMAGYGLLMGPVGWAIAGLSGALALGIAVQRQRPGAWGYAAALAWALLGIAVKDAGGWPGIALYAAAGIPAILWAARPA